MTNFQIAVLGFFIFFILLGVILFAGFGGGNSNIMGTVEIWGNIDKDVFNKLLSEIKNDDKSFENVKYRQVEGSNFDQELAEALASGTGPDIFILPQDSILKHKTKILPIPYDSYSLRDFKDKFIEEGELYLDQQGILGLPFTIDPMVTYWNRSIFSKAGIASPPKTWEEFFLLSQKITEKDDNLNILTSAVAFGEFRNIDHAKDIISTLIMQTGNPIITRVEDGVESVLSEKKGSNIMPAEAAVNFFTQFSNPVKTVYTWNRSLPSSQKSFIAGDLAIYFGFASELNDLQKKNPNLNFDVTSLPQSDDGINVTFGKMNALAITKNSKNASSAFAVIKRMTEDKFLDFLSKSNNLPPVSRKLLNKDPKDPYLEIFYNSALSAKAWLDPNPQETNVIFQAMIDSIVSGREKTANAIQRADSEMRVLIK